VLAEVGFDGCSAAALFFDSGLASVLRFGTGLFMGQSQVPTALFRPKVGRSPTCPGRGFSRRRRRLGNVRYGLSLTSLRDPRTAQV
jgi:hypothetical protein